MEAFGIVVIAVLVVSLAIGLWAARRPPAWDEYTGELLVREDERGVHLDHGGPGGAPPPSPADDEADLRALIDRKRARRGAPPRQRDAGPAWGHIEPDVLDEARELILRRARRHEREGKPPLDTVAELTRLLGPPHR